MLSVQLELQGAPHLVVPEALEIRRLGAGTAARDEQVAAVLEEQGHEPRVLHAGLRDALVGGRLGRGPAQVQLDATHERPVVGDVSLPQIEPGLRSRSLQVRSGEGPGLPPLRHRRSVVSGKAGGRAQEEGDLAGVTHLQPVSVHLDPSPVDGREQVHFEAHASSLVVAHGVVAIVVARVDMGGRPADELQDLPCATTSARSGLESRARKRSRPGRSQASRMTIAWSGQLAMVSRR